MHAFGSDLQDVNAMSSVVYLPFQKLSCPERESVERVKTHGLPGCFLPAARSKRVDGDLVR